MKVRISNLKASVVNLPALSPRRATLPNEIPTAMDRWVADGLLSETEAHGFPALDTIVLAPGGSVLVTEEQATVIMGGFASTPILEKAGHIKFEAIEVPFEG